MGLNIRGVNLARKGGSVGKAIFLADKTENTALTVLLGKLYPLSVSVSFLARIFLAAFLARFKIVPPARKGKVSRWEGQQIFLARYYGI